MRTNHIVLVPTRLGVAPRRRRTSARRPASIAARASRASTRNSPHGAETTHVGARGAAKMRGARAEAHLPREACRPTRSATSTPSNRSPQNRGVPAARGASRRRRPSSLLLAVAVEPPGSRPAVARAGCRQPRGWRRLAPAESASARRRTDGAQRCRALHHGRSRSLASDCAHDD
jgi:hypothetical protein